MKKALSYLLPFNLKKYSSIYSGVLEINLVNGKKILDTSRSNYSYGSLQKILHKGLNEIGFDSNIQSVLVLGMGGGSIIKTIREDFQSAATMLMVEIDPEIIAIAKNEFNIEKYSGIQIIQADAEDYLRACRESYDLIIVDLFIIDQVPEKFTRPEFIKNLFVHLNSGGKLIYNTLKDTMSRELFSSLQKTMEEAGFKLRLPLKVMLTNKLILAEKIANK